MMTCAKYVLQNESIFEKSFTRTVDHEIQANFTKFEYTSKHLVTKLIMVNLLSPLLAFGIEGLSNFSNMPRASGALQ